MMMKVIYASHTRIYVLMCKWREKIFIFITETIFCEGKRRFQLL